MSKIMLVFPKAVKLSIFSFFVCASSLRAQIPDETLLSNWHWRLVGPSTPAGRAWTVVGDDNNPKTMYVTTAGGGLWKTSNNGTTFVPVFNNESSASTGAVAIARSNSSVVWVGTGEPACTRANSWGDGAYKSTDGGSTWKNMGLTESREISAIQIHPTNAQVVYVAAMGYLWGTNSERGIFKTTDGGATWSKSLFVNDTTGFIDLQMDPVNPEVLYASAWQRIRWGDGDMTESGAGSGIYKTTNGGATWTRLSAGLPSDPMGKIHLAVGRRNSMIVYANILTGEPARGGRSSTQGGLYRSSDGGAAWTRMNDMQTSYYYDRVYVDPSDENTVWMPVFELWKSTDGGKTLAKANMKHVHNDLHSMWIDPNDPSHIVLSGDGGVNISYDRCASWQQVVLPIGQFYEVNVDTQDPYYIMGGMQDTGHWFGPSQTYDEEGITKFDWIKLRYNGDGMGVASDPRNPNVITMVQEFGNTSRLDMKRWDRTELQPADTAEFRKRGMTHAVRWDWTPAFALSRANSDVCYLGSNYLFRIDGRTKKWDVISPDLSRQQNRVMKGVTDGFHSYGALFSVAESPLDPKILWAGADDGPVWVTKDGGKQWEEVDANLPPGTPDYGVISEIEASRFAKGTAYIAIDCHTRENIKPYLFKTTDFGKHWSSITGNLPEKGSTYVIREDVANPNVLFCGTEFGVYVTIDGGMKWARLKGNLPTSGVRAMVIHQRERELVVGTFGRDIWVTDIAPLEELSDSLLASPVHLFKTKRATSYKLRETYGNTIEELNGDMFFRGENPPFGAEIVYYLKEDLHDSVAIAISSPASTSPVRSLKGPGSPGMHRVPWDLKKAKATAGESKTPAPEMTPSESDFAGRVGEGKYTVTLTAGKYSRTGSVSVRKEPDGVKVGMVRK